MSGRDSETRPKAPRAEEVRDELERWLAHASVAERDDYLHGRRQVTLSDGTHVAYQPEPGVLIVDGVRMYSAAWL
jgi:hypothetical protein